MQIVPVLDIQGGTVVRAIGGRRAEYRPLVSKLTHSTEPLAVASAIRKRFNFDEFYLADLDAIAGSPPATAIHDRLRTNDFRLWIDVGLRDINDADSIANHAGYIIVALETLRPFSREAKSSEPSALAHFIFSLDMRDGQPLGNWRPSDPFAILERVTSCGITRIIVLDLARVGTHTGVAEQFITSLVRQFPSVEFFVGGGVRGWNDIETLKRLGVAGVLIASALHDGLL
jgi:phosphoribosylformimino-5-aminoimidazole carboxamide ribotide isomerase